MLAGRVFGPNETAVHITERAAAESPAVREIEVQATGSRNASDEADPVNGYTAVLSVTKPNDAGTVSIPDTVTGGR